MTRAVAMIAVTLSVVLSACQDDPHKAPSGPADRPPTEAEIATGITPQPGSAPAVATPTTPTAASGSTPGSTPAFAPVYPGGVIEGEPTLADGSSGPGGILTFTTEASPERVVDFYRQKAEAAGLASMSSMNQGDTRAYGAANERSGARLEVVASPAEEGASVLLSWSAGQ